MYCPKCGAEITHYSKYCRKCGTKLPYNKEFEKDKLTAHHIIMKSRGGEVTEDNILIACCNCHFGTINHIKYDSDEYWELMRKSLAHRNEPR